MSRSATSIIASSWLLFATAIGAERLRDPGLDAVVQTGHGASISSVAISRDGRLVASGGVDQALKLWESDTGREVRSFRGHGGNVIGIAFTADDQVLVSVARMDSRLRVWEVATGRTIAEVDLPSTPTAFAASPGGSQVAVATRDGHVQLVDAEHWTLRDALEPDDKVVGLGYLEDGRLVVGGRSGSLQIWDPASRRKSEIALKSGPLEGIGVDGRSALAAAITTDGAVHLWNLEDASSMGRWQPEEKPKVVQPLAGGRGLLSADKRGLVQLWPRDGREPAWTHRFAKSIEALALAPDGESALVGGRSLTLSELRLATGEEIRSLQNGSTRSQLIAFSHDGSRVLTVSQASLLQLWDVRQGALLRSIPASALDHVRRLRGAALSPDGSLAAVVDDRGLLQLWSADEARELARRENAHRGSGTFVAFSPDGARIATGGADRCVRVWKILKRGRSTGLGRSSVEHCAFERPPMLGVFSPTGKALAIATARATEIQRLSGKSYETLHLWSVDDGAASSLETRESLDHLHFDTGGKTLWVVESSGRVVRWKLPDRTRAQTGIQLAGYQHRFVPGPDGDFAVSTSRTNRFVGFAFPTLKLWDLRSQREIGDFGGHAQGIRAVGLSPDGRTLVTAGDADLRVWDVPARGLIATLRSSSDGEWVVATPDGYFASSPEGTEGIYWVLRQGVETFPLELFEGTYRRPDLIRRRLAGELDAGSPAPVPKRPPRVTLRRGSPRVAIEGEQATLAIRARAVEQVQSVRAFVNGRPAASRKAGAPEIDVDLTVPVARGQNRVHVVAYDETGVPSNPLVVDVDSRGGGAGRIRVVSVGVSEYSALSEDRWLRVADDDARAVARALSENAAIPVLESVVLLNDAAERDAILAAVEALSDLGPRDLAILFLAGHGVRSGDHFFFLPHDASEEDPSARGLDWQRLRQALASVPSRVVLLLDACHSASLGDDIAVDNDTLAGRFFAGDGRGIMVFSASKGRQKALEDDEHGFFARWLLRGIGEDSQTADRDGNGFVEFLELVDFVTRAVSEQSRGAQIPWLTRRAWFGDFPIASAGAAP